MTELKQKVLTAIFLILNDSNFTETLIEMVLNRLESLSYDINEDDSWAISFSIMRVVNHIRSTCNIQKIPEELYEAVANRSCGEFLLSKKQSGKLDESFNLDSTIEKVQMGDTNITFSNEGNPEKRLNQLINYLISDGEGDLVCYRKLRW